MELFHPWHLISTFIVFIIGLMVCFLLKRSFNLPILRVVFLYIWHSVFCVLYAYYVVKHGGDAISYYTRALEGNIAFSLGTSAVRYIVFVLVEFFQLPFLSLFFIFNILGSIGLLAFDASLRTITKEKSQILRLFSGLIVFLPSISFWSSAIGKDAISFMAIGLALWASLDLKHRTYLMAFSILSMLLVRPHMASLMLVALFFSIIFEANLSFIKRFLMVVVGGLATLTITFLAIDYIGLGGSLSIESVIEYFDKRQGFNMDGGGGVNISEMSLPVQLFTYLFRPLPFEAHNLFVFAASVENVILLLIFIAGIIGIIRQKSNIAINNRFFLWIYCGLSWGILSVTTANLGISARQKWMFVPMLIFLLVSSMGCCRKNYIKSTDEHDHSLHNQ